VVARDHPDNHGMVTALRCAKSPRCFSDRELCLDLEGLGSDYSCQLRWSTQHTTESVDPTIPLKTNLFGRTR
jgi:hypothetical protein